jgi:hypothetical protein
MMALDREALRTWLEASCAAQGVPVVVTDPVTIARVGVLLRDRDAAGQPPAGGDRSARTSQPPGGANPVRVHGVGVPALSSGDGGEVEHSGDNRRLTRQR